VATGSVYVTNNVTTSNVVATGSVYVTTNVNAANIISTNVTASGNVITSNVFVTSNITTGNIVATGSVYLGGNVTTSNVVATGSVYLAGNVTTSNVVATGSVYVTSNVTTSNVVATGNVWVTSNVQASNVVASKLHISGTTQLVGQANTTADLGVGGNLYVPNNLIMSQSPASATIYALTVGSGGLTVQGNFILSQPTIYNAPSFTLYGTAPITGGNFGSFEVNRLPGTNASIRWSETNKEWATANVISGTFYRILTDENASGSSSLNNSLTYATSYALANANNYLQSYNSTANTGLKSYGDATYFAKTGGTISGAVTISSGGLISTASPIGIASGGTNNNTFTSSQLLYFNGTSIASLPGATAYSGVGSSTAIPVITTDIYGRVTSLSTASISTTLGIAGTTGSGSVALASQTLTVTSSTPTITSVTASGQTITIASQTSGVAASTYGTSTAIPVLTIDTYGRVTSASTTGISTTITLAGGSGSGSVSGGGTLTINGGTAISTSVSSGTYTINNTGVTSFSTNLTGLTPQTSTTGSVVLAGTLGVASGGTGVTTSTGTGSVVLSASPTFTGTVSGISATMVGLGSVTNESKATMFTSPTFTGTVSGITKSMVGLSNVDNTADASKSVSYASTAGSANANDVYSWAKAATKPSYTKSEVGLSNVDNTADASKSVSYASTAGSANANDVYSWAKAATKPSYTKSEVGLSNVDNTADASKSVSYASTAGTAGNLTGTPNISVGTITATVAAGGFSSILTGTVAGATVATKIENLSSAVNSRSSLSVLCGSSNETAISLAANRYAEQTELIAEGSDFYIRATNRPMYICTNYSQIAVTINPDRSVNFTGTVNGITKSMVGLGNVDNTADASKSVSYASTAGTAGNITAYTINQNLGTTSTVTFSTVTSSAFYYSSDARLKTNITKLTNHWDILNNLRPVNFDWISTGKKSQGLLAQEVQNVLPEAVNTSSDGTLSIDSSGIIAHLIASVQDLKSEIEELKKKLEK
jgi:disulfide oxidoreductase YuzD